MSFGPSENRRRSPRKWITVPVRINSGDSTIDGIAINVSEGGMYLFAAANFSLGAEVEVAFRPGERSELVRTSGIVQRRALYLYAIEFLNNNIAVVTDHSSKEETNEDSSAAVTS
jgi:hypothetical protein